MCEQAPVCACKVRIASFGAAAVGTMVAAVAIFLTEHLVWAVAGLVLCAAATVALMLALRRSAALSVAYWPSRVAAPARAAVERTVPRALPAARLAIEPPAVAVIPAAGYSNQGQVVIGAVIRDHADGKVTG